METLPPRTKTRPMARMEARLGRPLGDVLNDLYHREGLTLAEVAGRLGVSVNTVMRWMSALDIETRFPGQKGKPTSVGPPRHEPRRNPPRPLPGGRT